MWTRASFRPPKTPWVRLALLLLACALLRGWLIVAPPDDFFEHGAVPHEELLRGVATKDIIDGPLAPLQDYQVNNFWGGSLFVSLVAIVPYSLFGATITSLRLVALGFGLAAVALLFLVLWRHASQRAAWIGATLLAFAPPGYALSSCTLYGTHLESNAVALGLFLLYLEWRARDRNGALRALVLGACAGFAVWFGFSLLFAVLVLVVLELAHDRYFFARRAFVPVIAGFLVGLVPWIRYNALHGFSGFDVYDTGIVEHLGNGFVRGGAPEKLLSFFARDWATSFWFQDAPGIDRLVVGRVLEIVFAALIARAIWVRRAESQALCRALVRRTGEVRATPALLAGLFLGIYFTAYTVTAFDLDEATWVQNYRYMMPLPPFVALLAAVVLDDLALRSVRGRALVIALTLTLALVCALGTLVQARPERIASNRTTSGTSEKWLQRFLVLRFGADLDLARGMVERIDMQRSGDERRRLLEGFARGVAAIAAQEGGTKKEIRHRQGFVRTRDELGSTLSPELRTFFERPARSP